MKKILISSLVAILVSGCGSGNDNSEQTTPPQIEEIIEQSEMQFYVPSFVSQKGVLTIVDLATNTIENKEVEEISSFKLSWS